MEISAILAHPSQDRLDHAFARAMAGVLGSAGHDVRWQDLAVEGFDPLPTPQGCAS